MTSHPPVSKSPSFYGRLADVFIVAGMCLWLSAGIPFLTQPMMDLIGQKPWIHRAVLTAVVISVYGLIFFRVVTRDRRGGSVTPVIDKLRKLPLGIGGWITVLFLFSGTVWTVSSIVRHEAVHTSFDMAIFVQSIWTFLHGEFFYTTIKGGISVLGDHFSPILGFYALFYALWTSPWCLFVLQAFLAASTVFALDAVARYYKLTDGARLALAVCFFLYLPVRNAVRFDFHPEILAMPVLVWAFYFLKKEKAGISSLFLFAALLCKENAALVTCMFGLYALLIERRYLYGLFWSVFSVFYFFAVIHVIIPALSGQEYFYLSGNFSAWREEGMGAFVRHVVSKQNAVYLIKIYFPVAFFSFLSPATFLLNLPILAQNLTARNEMVRSIFFQYTMMLTPFVFISTAAALNRFRAWKPAVPLLIFCSLLMTGVPETYVIYDHALKITPGAEAVKRIAAEIPSRYSVRTHEFVTPHTAHRRGLHIYENTHPREGASESAMNADRVVLWDVLLGGHSEEAYQRLIARGYRLIRHEEGVSVFANGEQDSPA